MKKILYPLIVFIMFSNFIFANNDVFLQNAAKEDGMTFYWDSLSETGILEKNGHQLSFRKNEEIVLLDNLRMAITDAPSIIENQIYVSKDFMETARDFFKEDEESLFKVGAILIDAGHGGKDPGAGKTYSIKGKNVTIQEKDINLKVAKMLYERLKTAYPDKQIILTRSTDVFLSLGERTDIANKVKVAENEAVLFISIHAN